MRLNDEIKGVKEVRLIDEDGAMLGVATFAAALEKAKSADIDLCEISPNAEPPVCRIMDYGKFLYQQKKKEHDNLRRHHSQEQKQIRIKSFRIDPHDLEIKQKTTRKFIEAGHRVLVTLMFRARENDHPELGRAVLEQKLFKPLEDVARMESAPQKEGKRMVMSLSPVPNLPKILEKRKAELKKAGMDKAVQEMESQELPEDDSAEMAHENAHEHDEAHEHEHQEVTHEHEEAKE